MRVSAYILLLFIIINSAHGEDDKNFILRKRIMETKKKIESYNSKSKEIEGRTEEFSKKHAERVKKRRRDISRLGEDVSKFEKELRVENIKIMSNKKVLKNLERQFAVFRKKIKENMNNYNQSILKGLPKSTEDRSLNVSRLISDTEFANITTEEIFNRYYIFLNKELITGLDSEVYVKDNIEYLRIGWILLAYSDSEGKNVGLLTRKDGKWVWRNSLDFSMRKAIRDSIKMVKGKKAPELIKFPIPLALIREDLQGAFK
ncbi:MAG: DUF3450 family protein [Spirochaetota bacterium]|nr:DUF3450 family protein [Spirochaetota bacterium]